jgi:EAL domain-containing protein (putative c-di-GMP-specific phosphodiesterase class I)
MMSLETILQGLENDEFVYYYQPKVSLISGKVIGAEALIRWIKTDGTVIPPSEFIPLAEQSGVICSITQAMFAKLARDLLLFLDIDPNLIVSFNTTAQDFASAAFRTTVLETIDRLKIPASNLEIEITETTVLKADAQIKRNIQTLRNAGIGLAMDDYGTGFSTLDTLSQWPFSTIKLDGSIVKRMLSSAKNQTIAESSIRMAHELSVNVVAEGVELEAQYQNLLECGCSEVQGYLLSKPLALDAFIAFVQQDLRWSGMPIGLINMAIVDHIQWRRKMVSDIVRAACLPPMSEVRRPALSLPVDHRECRLGKWYYGLGQQFKGCDKFDAIEQPHIHLHELGEQLVRAVNAGAALHDLTPLLTAFSDCSVSILDSLQRFEHEGLIDMHSHRQTWGHHQKTCDRSQDVDALMSHLERANPRNANPHANSLM